MGNTKRARTEALRARRLARAAMLALISQKPIANPLQPAPPLALYHPLMDYNGRIRSTDATHK
jgi:hypothetical protein